jgi:glycolate oxidase
VIRNFVKGLEVVLPSGDILQFGGKLIKSSTGYSLLHLMIGSEGTLGIVTKVFVNLFPPPHTMITLVAPYEDLSNAIKTVPAIIQNKILPMAVEFMEHEVVMVSEDFINKKWPCRQGKAHLMIILDGPSEDEVLALAERVGEICVQNGALDVFVADTRQKQHDILEIRSQIYEATRNHMVEILDLTVPRAEITRFVNEAHRLAEELGLWLPNYGHAADGNVHTNIMRATWKDGQWTETPLWQEKYPGARDRLHEIARQCNGIVSGEHGIGAVKKEYVQAFLGGKQVELMKAIKSAFDPNGIMNPGKIW